MADRTTVAERAAFRTIVQTSQATAVNRVPFALPKYLPGIFAGRATAFMPDVIRVYRNRTFWLVAFVACLDVVSMGLGGARGGLSKASAGIHGVMLAIAGIEWYGLLKLSMPALVGGGLTAVGIPLIFALFVVLTVLLSQAGENPADAVLILIFLGVFVDFLAGLATLFVAYKLASYARRCKVEDEELEAQVAQTARAEAPPLPPTSVAANPVLFSSGSMGSAADLSRGLQPLLVGGGYVLPPNAGTAALPPIATPVPPPPPSTSEARVTIAMPPAPPPGVLAATTATTPSAASSTSSSASSVPSALPPCDICQDSPRTTAFVPCGHLACYDDAVTLQGRIGKCHLCRRPIQSLIRVYLD